MEDVEEARMSLLTRDLSEVERVELERLSGSRTAERRLVDRARIILAASRVRHVCDVARAVGFDKHTVRMWVKRFSEEGLEGLQDRPRSGHPRKYTAEDRSLVVATALTNPAELGLHFGEWSLERLAHYLNAAHSLPISPARVGVVLREEGLRWKEQEKWLSTKAAIDPAFVEKRGPLSEHTQARHPTRSSSASMRWGR